MVAGGLARPGTGVDSGSVVIGVKQTRRAPGPRGSVARPELIMFLPLPVWCAPLQVDRQRGPESAAHNSQFTPNPPHIHPTHTPCRLLSLPALIGRRTAPSCGHVHNSRHNNNHRWYERSHHRQQPATPSIRPSIQHPARPSIRPFTQQLGG